MEAEKLLEGYEKLLSSDSKSLLKKYLTPQVFENLKNQRTSTGAGLLDVVQSGETMKFLSFLNILRNDWTSF